MSIDDEIRGIALLNAIEFKGKASVKAVSSKILGMHKNLRSDAGRVMKLIQDIVKEVNSLGIEEQKLASEKSSAEPLVKVKKEVKEGLHELDGVDRKRGVIMRFAPSASGPMHLGHVITGGLSSLYARKYDGKFILRIEDTNSDNIYFPAYEMLPQDAQWAFGNVSEVWIQSDRVETYYKYAKKLLKSGSVYVCTCSQKEFRVYSSQKQDCPCRELSIEENLMKWHRMLNTDNGFKVGEAVVRFKSGMKQKNPALRDFPLLRINDSMHPRQRDKYRVWPLMNFSVTVDDIEAGMTHIIRGKDHLTNAKRQEMIYKALDLSSPKTYFIGRLKFRGMEVSCSKTRKRIEAGEFGGWDDIRLPFLVALKRRGYQPGALMKLAETSGLSPADKVVKSSEFFKALNAFNKEIIDPVAQRFFFIENSKHVEISNAPKMDIEMDLHPDNLKGGRKFRTTTKYLIEKKDWNTIEPGQLIRLMECLNFMKEKGTLVYVSKDYEKFRQTNGTKKIIHWLPDEQDSPKVEILMPNNTIKKGVAEKNLERLRVDNIIQFVRFGFCRLDEIEDKTFKFWYAHN